MLFQTAPDRAGASGCGAQAKKSLVVVHTEGGLGLGLGDEELEAGSVRDLSGF
jgi:hypothetical protein